MSEAGLGGSGFLRFASLAADECAFEVDGQLQAHRVVDIAFVIAKIAITGR
jgi:hypothetical protein